MVYFPTRKCYQAVKIVFLLVLVITVLALFEQWRGGKRNTGAMYTDPLEAEYERQILEDEARIIPGLGEGGVAAHLTGEEKRLGEESEKKLAINVYLSDRIAYNRTLKDFRNPACQRVVYDAELPSASVIIIFHNEPYSVVVRTIWSVVNSARRSNPWFQHANFVDQKTGRITNMGYPGQDPGSPFVYLKEVLLVDDNSTLPELKGKLSHYIRTRLPRGLVRLLRLPERTGLTRARLAGARLATGDLLVFLDSHCEAQPDWLRPLLAAIKRRPHAVVVPIIDVIETSNFYYSVGEVSTFQVGGFTFMGHFTWTEVPDREKKRRGSDIAPTWSPTMAGGLFAISRDYFWELGAYDEQMAGWGGENLEMSFRIWQCGGSLETIPCSRVGHVFRSFHPYGLPASSDTHGINTARMAEVWMDEYAELFYLHRPDLRNNPVIGDVTHRRVLREKLHCKSFQWYLDTVYPEKFVPVRDVYGYGRFKNEATQLCLDTLQREGDKVPLGAYPCYPALQATQYFSLSNKGELRDEIDCASVLHARIKAEERDKSLSRSVVMSTCHGKGRDQRWVRLRSGQLRHAASALCLTAPRAVADVRVTACDPADVRQIWTIDYTEDNNFKLNSDEEIMSEERERRISKLRGHRSNRISRSLTSYSEHSASHEPSAADSSTVRRHTHKSKHHKRRGRKAKRAGARRTKNKFLVRVARTLANGSEDHLEMDIHCRHRRLFPNNTFVRDLVTILNENNIKVINNGRVFERNKVTQLNAARAPRVLHKLDVAPPAQPPRQPPQPPATGGRVRGETKLSSELMATAASRQPAGDDAPGVGFGEAGHVEPRPVTPTAGRGAGGNKKLIIEDFVEVTSERARQAQKYRKHKRGRRPPPPSSTPPRPPQDHIFDGPRESAKDSAEGDWGPAESPLLDESAHRSGRAEHGADRIAKYRRDELKRTSSVALDSDEYHQRAPAADHVQDEGESREASRDYPKIIGDLLSGEGEASAEGAPRGVNQRDPGDSDVRHSREQATSFEPRYSLPLPRNSSAERVDKGAGRRSDDADGAPVKLVVRSNLTFDLADDLFSWKNKATDIVNEFLGELTIPSNDTEHLGGEGERPASSASESSAE